MINSIPSLSLLSVFFLISSLFSKSVAIGVNYGTVADNLPPPSQVAAFIRDQTTIDKIKIFDTNPEILRVFAGSDIFVTVTATNGDIQALSKLPAAQSWVANNISPFYPKTKSCESLLGTRSSPPAIRILLPIYFRQWNPSTPPSTSPV